MNDQAMTHRFDESHASKYDRKIRFLTPGYEALHQMANHLLHSLLPINAHVLVVGAGTGMDIITCGTANPQWHFTAVEPSKDMFALCRDNVAASGLSDRVHLHCGYTEDLAGPRKFDAATSIFVSHFIQHEQEKSKFFTDIFSRLQGGAPFIVADLHGDKDSDEFQTLIGGWRSFYSDSGVSKQEVEEAFRYIQRDISFVAESQFEQLLKGSRFDDIYLFFRAYLFGGWICRKQN